MEELKARRNRIATLPVDFGVKFAALVKLDLSRVQNKHQNTLAILYECILRFHIHFVEPTQGFVGVCNGGAGVSAARRHQLEPIA